MGGAPHPRMHGLTHVHGGPDPAMFAWEDVGGPGGGGGGGIQFDTPNAGGTLDITTSGDTNLEGENLTIIANDDLSFYTGGGGDEISIISGGQTIITAGSQVQINPTSGDLRIKLQTGWAITVLNHLNQVIFEIQEDGSLHGKTGKSLVFDL